MVGVEFGIFEVLVGYRKDSIEYKDFQQDGTLLGKPFAVSLGLLVFGIGGSF